MAPALEEAPAEIVTTTLTTAQGSFDAIPHYTTPTLMCKQDGGRVTLAILAESVNANCC